jgi:hypothetical protein
MARREASGLLTTEYLLQTWTRLDESTTTKRRGAAASFADMGLIRNGMLSTAITRGHDSYGMGRG